MNLLYAVEQAQTHVGQVLSNRQVQLCLNGAGDGVTPGKLFPGRRRLQQNCLIEAHQLQQLCRALVAHNEELLGTHLAFLLALPGQAVDFTSAQVCKVQAMQLLKLL